MVLSSFVRKHMAHNNYIYDYIINKIKIIDNHPINEEYKLKIIYKYLLPSCQYLLQVHEISNDLIERLDEELINNTKTLLQLPAPATPEIIFSNKGLKLPSFSHYHRICKANCITELVCSIDNKIQEVLNNKYNDEIDWKSPSQFSQLYNECKLIESQCNNENILLKKKEMKKLFKKKINDDEENRINQKLNTLIIQGNINQLDDIDIKSVQSILFNIPFHLTKFALKSRFNILPTASNLVRWKQKTNNKCQLCQINIETELHILAGCPVSANQGRYTWRHDSVLWYLYNIINGNVNIKINSNLEFYIDIKDLYFTFDSTVPDYLLNNFYCEHRKPDIFYYNKTTNEIILFELTVPDETNFDYQHQRKIKRYEHLITLLKQQVQIFELYCIEIGARGLWSKQNSIRLYHYLKRLNISINHKLLFKIKKDIAKIVLASSYFIFEKRKDTGWIFPPFINSF